jgi:hypothetical protein
MLDTLPHDWPDPAPTEILPGLWQGGTSESSHLGQPTKPNHYRGERPFDLIVTLYSDAQPAPWGVEEIRYGFLDGELAPHDRERIERIAARVAESWRDGGRVLVRCQAGVNRSGLVVAMAMVKLGWSAEDAVARARVLRSGRVLSNRHFRFALGLQT